MGTANLSNYEKLMIRRRIKRKKRTRNIILFVLVILLALSGFLIYKNTGGRSGNAAKVLSGITKNKKIKLKSLTPPEYVDVNLIHTGDARTGVKLVAVNDIVIHYTGNAGTTAQNNRDYFDKTDTDVCSHFVIGLDGEIIQCLPLDEKSAASNNRNLDTISIEVCHPDDTGKFTDATYDSLVKLTAWLCDNSSLKSNNVIRHYDITGKDCPKYYVENNNAWKDFLSDVKEELKNY